MHATDALVEADRLMTVCNSCRYCEGICAVFPAMEMRQAFTDGDLNYLANLCHNCGACYYGCQYSPPHEFDVNVPVVLSQVRRQSYAKYAWPSQFSHAFDQNGLIIAVAAVVSIAIFIAGFVTFHDPSVFLSAHQGPGAFYRLMPHNAMAIIFGLAFAYSIVAIAMGVRAFWRDMNGPALQIRSLWQAIKDTSRLRYLDGGGNGCMNEGETPRDNRRIYHHLTFYGFGLCFASTVVATGYHYVLGRHAPYPIYDLPVVLGVLGGVGLTIGPLGLLFEKARRDNEIKDVGSHGMETAFVCMLLLTGVTGLLLLALRSTIAMPMLLALHLGAVFALFVTMPYGKFVHGIYRFVALVHYAAELNRMREVNEE